MKIIHAKSLLFLLALSITPYADLPGEELSEELLNRIRHTVPSQTSQPQKEKPTEGEDWIQTVSQTWDAPSFTEQMAADQTIIPFGKGGIFIPRFSDTHYEPDLEIINSDGDYVTSGETGRTYALEPGEYFVLIGSGSHRQRMAREIQIIEGRTVPLLPDWSGLIIEIVDEQGMPIRGEYEIARIDQFDPYGRGYGANIELGENVRTWVVRPGTYKIIGVGEGYSTLTNFVTVRLVPGEFTRFLLIQNAQNQQIMGGGIVHMTQSTSITPNWRYGANIGGNAQFNAEINHDEELSTSSNSLTLSLLIDTWIIYRKKPVEWTSRLRLEEGFNISGWDIPNMINTPDKLTMSSMFIWRFLSWLGPYSRLEFNTSLFPEKIRRGDDNWFAKVDTNYFFNTSFAFDSTETMEIEPAFSPITIDLGSGVNADVATFRMFESKMRLGFGSTYSVYADRYRRIESSRVNYQSTDDSLLYAERITKSNVLFPESSISIFEFGPQASVSGLLRMGHFATAEIELKIFAPIAPENRIASPDLDFSSIVSWRLSRALTLDYTYRRHLRQPADLEIPDRKSTHGIWLRLHYSSR